MKILLTIAGFDPSSGAGVTADLMVFAAHGHYGTSAITALTVQSTLGVRSSQPVDAALLRQTLECLEGDLPPAGIKIGMLATAEIVAAVAEYLAEVRSARPEIIVVLDPVLRSSSGRELLSDTGVELLRSRLLPWVDWITPNTVELSQLSGLPVNSAGQVEPAARELQALQPTLNVLATGGHLEPPDDLLLPADCNGTPRWITGSRIDSTSTHGTGCALSSALLSRLVEGTPPLESATAAKQYVTEAILTAEPIGHGHGPLHHLWPLRGRLPNER